MPAGASGLREETRGPRGDLVSGRAARCRRSAGKRRRMMTPSLDEILEARLGDLERAGLLRAPVVLDGPTGPRVRIGEREFLLFASNDYLGLAAHPALAAAGIKAIEAYGAGSGASRLVSGSLRIHAEAEEAAASFERRRRRSCFRPAIRRTLASWRRWPWRGTLSSRTP